MFIQSNSFVNILLWPAHKVKRVCERIEGRLLRNRIRRKKKNNRIVFLANFPQGWNSFKTVYSLMKNSESFEVILLAWLGWPYPGNDEEFWKSIDNNAIISSPEHICDLLSLDADIIFRQTPYDGEYPPEYSAKAICKHSKLCYIPYNYNSSPNKHLVIEYNDGFFPFLFAIFCDNNTVKEYCDHKAKNSFFTSDILCFDYGFPRFDIIDIEPTKEEYNCFLWTPRWSLDPIGNDATGFFLYYEKLTNFFSKHQELTLIIRPHPSMLDNFVREGALTEEDVKEIRDRINKSRNIFLDESADYINSFNKSDVLISDFSSLVVEYYMTCKPIMYCGGESEFNKETIEMIRHFYSIKSWNDMEYIMLQLVNGNDCMLEKRIQHVNIIKKHKHDTNSTYQIVKACLDEL